MTIATDPSLITDDIRFSASDRVTPSHIAQLAILYSCKHGELSVGEYRFVEYWRGADLTVIDFPELGFGLVKQSMFDTWHWRGEIPLVDTVMLLMIALL